jgi:hypothetical protein
MWGIMMRCIEVAFPWERTALSCADVDATDGLRTL